MTRCVGVDLYRCRSVIVVLGADGTELWTHRIDDSPVTLGLEIEQAGPAPEVVLEATWGWYWAADVISQAGGLVHLAHPLGIAGYENRRVRKTPGCWLTCYGWGACRRRGLHQSRFVINANWSVTGANCHSCGTG